MVPRIAALHLWALPLEVQFGGRPETPWDPSIPVAVRAEVRGRWILEAVSLGARRVGIRPGCTLSEAKARLPDIVVKDRDRSAELAELARVAELLLAFGPAVEICAPNVLFVEVGRSERALARRIGTKKTGEGFEGALAEALRRTLERAGHVSSVVLGQTPDGARTLAQHLSGLAQPTPVMSRRLKGRGRGRGVTQTRVAPKRARGRAKPVVQTLVVPPGGEARAQANLPLAALGWTDARQDPDGVLYERIRGALASLRVLGIEDVGRLAVMPSDQVASRFGQAGQVLMHRALGIRDRPLKTFCPPDRLVERLELEYVTEALEPVLFVLKGLFGRLADRLDARGLAVTEVDLDFLVEPGLGHELAHDAPRAKSSKKEERIRLRFARPTRKSEVFLALAQDTLGGALPGAVRSVTVSAVSPHADRGAQLDLFTAHEKRLEAVGQLVSRLQATLGDHAVFSPEIRDTHRPEAAWRGRAFDIDAALRAAPVQKPRKVEMSEVKGEAWARPHGQEGYALPAVAAGLSVTGMGPGLAADEEGEAAAKAEAALADPAKARPWPKPVPREPADEPLPPLPQRPAMLFARPERVTVLRSTGIDEGVLVWRGQRHHLVQMSGRERLEAEWWTRAPVERDYVVAEVADGRRFWLYFAPEGEAFVHGIFD